MDERFHATYAAAARRSAQRIKAVEARDPLDIEGLVEAVLPLDVEHCLKGLAEQARLSAGVDTRDTAGRLAALVPAVAAEAIFDPRRWTATPQRRVVRSELTLIGLT